MSKYLTFFVALVICVSPAFGDNDPPPMHPEAQKFLNHATTFFNSHSGDMSLDDGYLNAIETIAKSVPADADRRSFDVDKYFSASSGIVKEVQDMMGKFDNSSAPAKEIKQLKQEYLDEVANFFIKEYGNDLSLGVEGINTQQYIDDMKSFNKTFENNIASAEGPPVDSSSYGFNPAKFLDKAAGETRRDARIEFVWGGLFNDWVDKDIYSLMQIFQTHFRHDRVAQNEFKYLMDLWPKKAEVYMMNTAYDGSDYYITDPNDPSARQNNFVIDEYGMPTDDYDETQVTANGSPNTSYTASYNNRTYGYSDGDFDLVTITTNGHKYSLQEHFYTSPLILDMDGDGAITASNGEWLPHRYQGSKMAEFDMNGDGFIDVTEWVGPQDGLLLVYDKTKEVDANDLFGNAGGYEHGYEELSLLDKNEDGKISGEETATLSVWQDKNGNAKVDQGEVATLQELGITAISLNYDNKLVSEFTHNGQQKKVFDWYPNVFIVKKMK